MTKIRIHFTYRHVEKPWGGANNFIRALHEDLRDSHKFVVVPSVEDPCDILFMNQLGSGPGGNGDMISLQKVRRWVEQRMPDGQRRKLVVRAVNLHWHAFPLGPRNLTRGWWIDRQTIKLLNMADAVIFQSAYQREFFLRAGFRGKNDLVIHNGASASFWLDPMPAPPLGGALCLISSTAAPRATKRHDLIAQFSLLQGVEVLHMGAWPEGLNPCRVKLLGMLPREEMLRALSVCHYFLHPATNDPCPNSIFEAICAGKPVIYNPGPGSSREIVGECGIALDEADLAETAVIARERLPALRAIVEQKRYYFSINHSATKYKNILEELGTDCKPIITPTT